MKGNITLYSYLSHLGYCRLVWGSLIEEKKKKTNNKSEVSSVQTNEMVMAESLAL